MLVPLSLLEAGGHQQGAGVDGPSPSHKQQPGPQHQPWSLSSVAVCHEVWALIWQHLPHEAKKAFALTCRAFRDASRELVTSLDVRLCTEQHGFAAGAFHSTLPHVASMRVGLEEPAGPLAFTAFLVTTRAPMAAMLTELELHGQAIDAAVAGLLARSAPALRSLAVTLDGQSGLALAALALCHNLVDLQCNVESLAFRHTHGLVALTRLTSLELASSVPAPHGDTPTLRAVSSLSHLQYLSVYGSEDYAHPTELRHLSGLASLEGLRLSQFVGGPQEAVDASMAHLANLTALDFLLMVNDEEPVQLGAAGLAALGPLTALTGLQLNRLGSDLVDADWHMPSLKYVNLATEGYFLELVQLAAMAQRCPQLAYVQNDIDAWQKRVWLSLPRLAAPGAVSEAWHMLAAVHERRLLEAVYVQQLPDADVLQMAVPAAAAWGGSPGHFASISSGPATPGNSTSPPSPGSHAHAHAQAQLQAGLIRVITLECSASWAASRGQMEWLFGLMPCIARLSVRPASMVDLSAVLGLRRLTMLRLHELPGDATVEDLCRFVGRLPAAFTRLAVLLPEGALTGCELRAVRAVLQGSGADGITLSVAH